MVCSLFSKSISPMRVFNVFIILLCTISLTDAQQVQVTDSIEIISKIDDWNKAWDIKDPILAAKWYTDDADFTNAFGFNLIGKSAIEEYLTQVFQMDFVMAGKSEQTSIQLKFLSENVMLAISTISRKGQKMNDGTQLGDRRTTHHRVFTKDGDWQITAHLISDARSIHKNDH